MLQLIRAKDVLKWVFNCVHYKKKLKLIIYNKELQNQLDINKSHYEEISIKVLIIDENGIGKIKNKINDFVYFIGQYVNNKINGKGIEYQILSTELSKKGNKNKKNNFKKEDEINSNYYRNYKFKEGIMKGIINDNGKEYMYEIKVKFEGEFKDGIKNGKGKEYDLNDNVLFDGEYLNGKRWNGKGIEYDDKQKIYFQGKYKNGEKVSGKMILYMEKGRIEYDLRNKKGKEFDSQENIVFEGEFLDWKRWNGVEKYYGLNRNIIAKYELKNGERNGKTRGYDYGKSIFEGEYKNGKLFNGKGIRYYDKNNSIIFCGEYKEGKRYGFFKEYNSKIKLLFHGQIIKVDKYGLKYNEKGIILFNGQQKGNKRFNGVGKYFIIMET